MSLTVFLFEVVEPFFSLRLHPYTSLRESLRRHGGWSGPQEPDTEYSAATVSHCMAVSFRADARLMSPSPRALRLALQARASSSSKKGRCNLPLRFRFLRLFSKGFR